MSLPISVIIVVKNGESTIEDCLRAIQSNSPYEIIIVDGQSSDRTLEIARKYTQRIYSDQGRGVSLAHQIGAEQATQKYIAYVDSDIVLTSGCLLTMLNELQSSSYSNVQARLIPLKRRTYWERAQDKHANIRKSRVSGGLSAAILDREITLKVGFDPSIKLAGDDYDFLLRLEKAGYTRANSKAEAYHVHRATFKDFYKQRFWYGKSKPALIKKYGFKKLDLWVPLTMFYWLGFCIIKGQLSLIPYFLTDGAFETAGMVKGFLGSFGTTVNK